MIFYVYYTMDRFVNGLPEIVYTNSPARYDQMNFTNTFKAGIFVQSGVDNSNFLNNASFGTVEVSQKTKINKITNNSATLWLETFPCNFTNQYSGEVTFGATHTLCFNLSLAHLKGTYEDEVYTYIKIELLRCRGANCASDAEIESHIVGANLNLVMDTYNDVPNGPARTTTTAPHWRLFPSQVLGSDLFLTRYTLKKALRVIGSDSTVQSRETFFKVRKGGRRIDGIGPSFAHHIFKFDHTEDFPRPTTATEATFAELYFRLSRTEIDETRSRGSFLDVLASWGALIGFIYYILGIPVTKLNEFLFRLQLPLDKKDDLHTFLYTDFDEYGRLPVVQAEVAQGRQARSRSIVASLVNLPSSPKLVEEEKEAKEFGALDL